MVATKWLKTKVYFQLEKQNNLILTSKQLVSTFPVHQHMTPLPFTNSHLASLTDPDNQPCNFPYTYSSSDMYFCRRSTNGTYSCPTDAGVGRCRTGQSSSFLSLSHHKLRSFSYTVNRKVRPDKTSKFWQNRSLLHCNSHKKHKHHSMLRFLLLYHWHDK